MRRNCFHRSVRNCGFTLTDLLTCLCITVLCAAAAASPLEAAREQARRVKCASNLRAIGLAIQMYANENKGNFPRTRFDNEHAEKVTVYSHFDAKDPFKEDGPGPNDVTSALYLLIRTQDITPAVFVCPSSDQRPIIFGEPEVKPKGEGKAKAAPAAEGETDPAAPQEVDPAADPVAPNAKPVAKSAQDISNFPGPQYLSYSYINPYPSRAARNAGFKLNYTLTSDFPIASDLNPGGTGPVKVKREDLPPPSDPNGRRVAAKFTAETKKANSLNHSGFGQNVLYADGHVEFQPTPWCGMKRSPEVRDNIFTAEISTLEKSDPKALAAGPEAIMSPSLDEKDSILLPVAAKPASKEKAPKPEAEKK